MKNVYFIFILLPLLLQGQNIVIEEIDLKNGQISIPGTLSYPKTKQKVPLLIFVHGSGNVDRNGNQGGLAKANYIAQLSDSLTKNGIALYRYDKRTSNTNNFKFLKNISLTDFVDDVSKVIAHFKNDNRFKSIHLIGHSQGSLVAMLAADDNIKSYISLAGPSNTIDSVISKQLTEQNEGLGKIAKEHFAELAKTDTILSVNPMLLSIFAPQNQKFFKSWMSISPTSEIKKINKPILIIQGEKDLQINTADANNLLNAITENSSVLEHNAELILIDNMNHVLKEIEKQEENLKSYTSPNFPLSSELVNAITTFILRNE
ncbi:alpha/beta hydrolase family protein [Croceitalea marina]|uniref:Alpha/beta hydrolase family protein n=1 Tax=Croceitalea marina TaxID=1775166 RepID=A0ABW5MSF8_9FLAO